MCCLLLEELEQNQYKNAKKLSESDKILADEDLADVY